jgi:hypothetical protein
MSLFDQLAGASGPKTPTCSRKACGAEATWQLLWNNPRIHTPERRKVWLACDEHADWLHNYLSERGLFRESLPLAPSAPPQES